MGLRTGKLEFAGADGATLSARLDLPLVPPIAYAMFAHCFTCSKVTRAATYLAAALAEQGIAMLRFDFTGLAGSSGDFASTSFSSNVGDLVAAADFLRANCRAPEILVGHSLGGTAVLAAARPKVTWLKNHCAATSTLLHMLSRLCHVVPVSERRRSRIGCSEISAAKQWTSVDNTLRRLK